MAMEQVTVEYNGEIVTLEVPEGTSDKDIQSYLSQGEQQKTMSMNQIDPSLSQPLEGMAEGAAIRGLVGMPQQTVTSPVGPIKPTPTIQPGLATRAVGEVADLAKIAGKITPAMATDALGKPLSFLSQIPGAFAERYLGQANMNKSFGDMAKGAGQALMNPANLKNVATGVGAMALAPENMFGAPYQMAAYEQEKIRANPNAPQYANNPYAQMTRGEAPTQGSAGAMNRRAAIAGQQYGGLTAEEQSKLESDRLNIAIRLKAAKKVLGQQ